MASNYEHHLDPVPSSLEEPPPTHIQFSLWHTFKHHIPHFLLTILFDVILPLVLFFVLQEKLKSVYALLIAGIPPLFMIFIKAIRTRTLDALGFLVFISFLISAIVAVVTKNDLALLLEKSLNTAIVSLIFAITLIPPFCCFKHRYPWRPIAYYLYQDLVPIKREEVGLPDNIFNNVSDSINKQQENEVSVQKLSHRHEVSQVYDWIYTHCSFFRLSCYLITIIWSIGFFFEFTGRLILIAVHLSVDKIVIYGRVILTVITVICIILTIICVIKERKQTLATIQQWKEEHFNAQQQQQQLLRRSNVPVWTVTNDFNENTFL